MNVTRENKKKERIGYESLLGSNDQNMFFKPPDVVIEDELASLAMSQGYFFFF